MNRKHLTMSTLQAALPGVAGASGLARDRHHGGDWRRDGAGPDRDIFRDERLAARYRSYRDVVNDWREHNLRPPPRGRQPLQAGGGYAPAASPT